MAQNRASKTVAAEKRPRVSLSIPVSFIRMSVKISREDPTLGVAGPHPGMALRQSSSEIEYLP